jgi:hypothetical protein
VTGGWGFFGKMTLKKLLSPLIILTLCSCSIKKDSDPVLEQRLAEFLKAMDDRKPEKMMDYIYPKLFTIVSRDQTLMKMTGAFESKDPKVEFDSLKIEKIFPIFEMDSARYAKVIYAMVMTMEYSYLKDSTVNKNISRDTSTTLHTIIDIDERYPAPQLTLMQTLLKGKYGTENVTVDYKNGIAKVRVKNQIVAIKDKFAGEWSFVTATDEEPLPGELFSKAVLDKLATYKKNC